MGRGSSPLQTLASSPTMVGAITTLIVIVAVFLAYNANNGLPFVPVYRVSVDVPNASRLVVNNEVRIGGSRVGVVESIEAVRDPGADEDTTDGVYARLNLKLDESAGPIPQDSIFRVRYKSAFGLKFLEVTRGQGEAAPEGFAFNGTNDNDDPADDDEQILSIEEVAENESADDGTFVEQTEFDDIGNTFDQATRNAIRQNLVGYGDAFAARGASLNLTIESLNPLFANLMPVMKTLSNPETQLDNFFPALERTAAIVAPVADENAELFGNMATVFAAIGSDPVALQDTISGGPPTLETGIETLPRQRPFLEEFTELSSRLKPGVRQLRLALPDLNDAVRIGTPVLARSVGMNKRLREVFTSLNRLVQQPTTLTSLRRLEDTFDEAKPLAAHVAPAQTVCNYWNYWFTLLPEHLTERDSVGYTQRVTLIATPPGPVTIDLKVADPLPSVPTTIPGEVETGLSIGGYSGAQANGKVYGTKEFQPRDLPILHGNPAGPTGQDGSDCQSGQTGYALGEFRLPGQAAANPAVVAPDLPGDRGPTDVYFNRDGTRDLRDTRVEARQP